MTSKKNPEKNFLCGYTSLPEKFALTNANSEKLRISVVFWQFGTN
jgi:hypothetical protein